MRLYKCDVCGKILMITAGERTIDRVCGMDMCLDCASAAQDIDFRDMYIQKILEAKERGTSDELST